MFLLKYVELFNLVKDALNYTDRGFDHLPPIILRFNSFFVSLQVFSALNLANKYSRFIFYCGRLLIFL